MAYTSDKSIILKRPDFSDRYSITVSQDTFNTNRQSITISKYFLNTQKYIIHNFHPQTVREYRYIYQKSPHEYHTARKFVFGLHIPPNDIKKVVLNVCPKAVSDRYISIGTVYIPYVDRKVYLQIKRYPALRIVKNPDFFIWRYLPLYIDTYTFTVKKELYDIDWNSLAIMFELEDGQLFTYKQNNSDITIQQIRYDIYKVTFKGLNLKLPANTKVKILLHLTDIHGNYISTTLY